MGSKNKTEFNIDGTLYQFNSEAFKIYVRDKADKQKIKLHDIFSTIAQRVNVTEEAVKQWYYGYNGPGNIETIKLIPEVLDVSHLYFMKRVKEKEMLDLKPMQVKSLKRIYDAIIEFLNDFYETDGFTGSLWYEFEEIGSKDPEEDIYEYAEAKIKNVILLLQKEYFYLHDTEVYEKINEYVENDLYSIFDGKLSYAYRFEAGAEGNPTTADDYINALNRINEIIENVV